MLRGGWSLLLLACAAPLTPPAERPVAEVSTPPARPSSGNAPSPSVPPEVDDSVSAPLAVPARDFLKRPLRRKSLVLNAIRDLRVLVGGTPVGATDHARSLRSLADAFAELHRLDGRVETGKEAIARYELLLSEAGTLALDDVQYALGLEYELVGDGQSARRSYFTVVQRTPQSVWVPYAYFGFGELFLMESAKDPSKRDFARLSYEEADKRGAGASIAPWAVWRLSQLATAKGDSNSATALIGRLRRDFPQSDAVARIGETL